MDVSVCGMVCWRNMVRCVPPGNMISPPAANLIVRNGEEIRGCGRITVYQSRRRVYIGTLSLCSATIEGDHWSQGTVFGARSGTSCHRRISFSWLLQFLVVSACLPAEAKTSFESPVSALHAEAFVAARILLNMRQARRKSVRMRRRRRILIDLCLTDL